MCQMLTIRRTRLNVFQDLTRITHYALRITHYVVRSSCACNADVLTGA